MNFLELEDICKSPVPSSWVENQRSAIQEAIEEYKSWGNDPSEEQDALYNIVWPLSKTWSYEMIAELMPHLSIANQTTELVRMIESIGSENEEEYNKYFELTQCEPFFQKHVPIIPVQEQIEVLGALIRQNYPTAKCLDMAIRLAEITSSAIDWDRYEQEREENDRFYWTFSSEMVHATEHRTNYRDFFGCFKKVHPHVFFSALKYIIAIQTQGGYCPSPERIELFNERLMDFLELDFYEDLFQSYTTMNDQLNRRKQPTLQIPPRVLGFILYENVSEASGALRNKKM